eukprot:CAMPEP_0176361936 /NCGR_PEP_ID=MMETSP0126-20121128/18085_1 /TAXON_ID=141414 ORGANISM="Strombidinopsis acuminatum, Strain SPMC142" /NCGR_SAMPLE_ID=MMETSP0126 /ASSEMBLY_ACC=CAM_ASM_000229 /LENGTH=69 /DNA_ID=CAMNT_0017717669 /DNA_START=707 /DNA_END=916 /DNA_ORIENTATION=+
MNLQQQRVSPTINSGTSYGNDDQGKGAHSGINKFNRITGNRSNSVLLPKNGEDSANANNAQASAVQGKN